MIKRIKSTILSIYAPNNKAPMYMKRTLTELKGEIDCCPMTVGDFNIALSIMDRTDRRSIRKKDLETL